MTIEISTFRPIPGFGSRYEIDTFGNVRSVKYNRLIKPYIKQNKYAVRLHNDVSRKEYPIHKLMQLTFFRPSREGEAFYHKNGDCLDNSLNNLGFISKSKLGQLTGANSRRQPVMKIDAAGKVVSFYPSARAAARDNHMSYQTVMDRCNGMVKSQFIGGHQYCWDN